MTATVFFNQYFNGRAVFLQVGVMLGSAMTANVFVHIIRNQKKFMKALLAGKPHDLKYGKQAKTRSMHNHYMTFPVLFMMLSAHFPQLISADWLSPILGVIIVSLMLVKFFMNSRYFFGGWLVAIFIVLFLVTYVVPQVAQVFAGSKRALPLLTVLMIGLSDLARQQGWILLLALFIGAIGGRMALANAAMREKFDAFWLTLPVLGRLALGYNAARFANTLAMLAGAGVPILKALQAAAETLSNQAMRRDALEALVLVREGAPLAAALAQKKRFPGLLAMFARLGEQTGQLPLMLQRAAKQLSAEVQRRAMQLATLLEPLLIVAMGVIVMLIVLAVLLPIIQLNQLVK
jgi:hypothetical protein